MIILVMMMIVIKPTGLHSSNTSLKAFSFYHFSCITFQHYGLLSRSILVGPQSTSLPLCPALVFTILLGLHPTTKGPISLFFPSTSITLDDGLLKQGRVILYIICPYNFHFLKRKKKGKEQRKTSVSWWQILQINLILLFVLTTSVCYARRITCTEGKKIFLAQH